MEKNKHLLGEEYIKSSILIADNSIFFLNVHKEQQNW